MPSTLLGVEGKQALDTEPGVEGRGLAEGVSQSAK